jgi:hypothetical protein
MTALRATHAQSGTHYSKISLRPETRFRRDHDCDG